MKRRPISMYQQTKNLLFISAICFLSTVAVAEPIGTAFTYHGELFRLGTPASGLHDFEFSLFDQEIDGLQIGDTFRTEDVSVIRGRFAVELDFGSWIASDTAMWLEISARPAGGTFEILSPRRRLTPVPAAVFATNSSWSGLQGKPAGFADDQDNDSLASLACSAGDTLVYNGGWTCSATGGDVTSVLPTVGSGIVGGGESGDLVIDTDFNVIQKRVTGGCAVGQAIRSIASDGTVICSSQDKPEVVSDTGWFPAPLRNRLYINLGTSDYDFVFGMTRSWALETGQMVRPNMGVDWSDVMPAYVALGGSVATVVGYNRVGSSQSIGSLHNIQTSGGDLRLRAFKRTPDFDSGWEPCSANVTYSFSHNLGSFPDFATVEIAQNSNGTGWRVPSMGTSNFDGTWRQAEIVDMTSTTMKLRTSTTLGIFRNTPGGAVVAPTQGYCRIKLFDWDADYDSGWVSFSTAEGNREKWFRHDFGEVPSLVMVWIQGTHSGSPWVLPAMTPVYHYWNRGTSLYGLTEHWAVVKGGAANIAQFVNAAGAGITPTSGYVRFLAWR